MDLVAVPKFRRANPTKDARPATANTSTAYNTEWAIRTFATSSTTLPIISMTYTYYDHVIQWRETNVRVEGRKFRLTEPAMPGGAVVNSTLPKMLNTTAVQRLLDVESETPDIIEHRGIYRLLSYDPNFLESGLSGRYYCNPNDFFINWNWCFGSYTTKRKVIEYYKISCDPQNGPSFALGQLFNNTFRDTGRIGLALEAAATVLHADSYYQNMPNFEREGKVSMQTIVTREAPKNWRRFLIVLGFIALHTVLVVMILAAYRRSESFGRVQPIDDPSAARS
ncbi:hypothetical protein K440DRAFT_636534 [Wilcoxina mikolae CBS 423.85]|nr:hypothetical protein K440DRAFT_636534 [Wilcoxina mikolae CBS 423.85]